MDFRVPNPGVHAPSTRFKKKHFGGCDKQSQTPYRHANWSSAVPTRIPNYNSRLSRLPPTPSSEAYPVFRTHTVHPHTTCPSHGVGIALNLLTYRLVPRQHHFGSLSEMDTMALREGLRTNRDGKVFKINQCRSQSLTEVNGLHDWPPELYHICPRSNKKPANNFVRVSALVAVAWRLRSGLVASDVQMTTCLIQQIVYLPIQKENLTPEWKNFTSLLALDHTLCWTIKASNWSSSSSSSSFNQTWINVPHAQVVGTSPNWAPGSSGHGFRSFEKFS